MRIRVYSRGVIDVGLETSARARPKSAPAGASTRPSAEGGWFVFFFFFNDTATTEIYTPSLPDPLPICRDRKRTPGPSFCSPRGRYPSSRTGRDRKSTRLNSSHDQISYAVFCLKKK